MRISTVQGGLGAALLVALVAAAQAADVYLPRTRAHIKCHFADGSYTEYKVREKWYPHAEVIPHAQTYGALGATLRYVDVGGKRYDGVGAADLQCRGVGKRDGRVFWVGGFQDMRKQMITFALVPDKADEIALEPRPRPQQLPQFASILAELKTREFVATRDTGLVVPLDARQLLLEVPLTTSRHPDYPTSTVLYVLQSRSPDFGQSWSEPILTKKAELYEIGKTLDAQSWAPRREVVVQDRSERH
ncbi:MAG TPA: hypothetical protein VGC21_17260 [Telluria sp.]|jgi:hypothetical protein